MIKPLSMILTAAAISGCVSHNRTIDEMINPDQTIHIPSNVASKKWDGSKGEFPPGRNINNQTLPPRPRKVINYQGHGIGYESHAQHHYHHNQTK